MVYKVRVAAAAKRDAIEAARFIRDKQHSIDTAAIWLEGLYNTFRLLETSPNRYAVIAEAYELGVDYRAYVYHSHRVIYAVNEANKTVTIHRIWHGSRGEPEVSGSPRE